MNPRAEPLLWIQLLGLAVWPLEALLILVVLAGSDPGPAPLVEQVLCWCLGALAPALLLWRTPADVWSLLLARIPSRGRRDLQQRLSRLQDGLPLKWLGTAPGALLLLPLLMRLDQHAAMATPLWGSGHLPRLLALVLGALLLTLLLWQWQQVVQALWLLTRSEALLVSTIPLTLADLEATRLSPGLPLLLPPALVDAGPTSLATRSAASTSAAETEPKPALTPESAADPEPEAVPEPEPAPESIVETAPLPETSPELESGPDQDQEPNPEPPTPEA